MFFLIFHKPFKALYLPIITKLIFSHFSSISSGQLLSHRRFPRPAVARRRGASRSRSRCHSVLRRTGIKQLKSFSFGTHLISDKLCYQMIFVNSVVEEKDLNAYCRSSNPWGGLFVLFDFFHEAGYIN